MYPLLLFFSVQQYGAGLGDLMSSLGRQGPSARDYQRASLQGFDPRSTAAYNNPFENQVVQQTIDDVFKQGEKADIAQRARDISTGGESAFGSRARLSAEERRSALGRGLGEALAGIRSGGFDTAQKRAMGSKRCALLLRVCNRLDVLRAVDLNFCA